MNFKGPPKPQNYDVGCRRLAIFVRAPVGLVLQGREGNGTEGRRGPHIQPPPWASQNIGPMFVTSALLIARVTHVITDLFHVQFGTGANDKYSCVLVFLS